MAAEEDKKFDAVLGGFLVNDLRIRAGDPHCPESDTLAAYHERSLLPEEMNSWKEHIVGCARCQAILAELEVTESISLEVCAMESALEKEPLADPTAPLDVASRDATAAPPRVPAESRVTPISRSVRWQWLAPAGALAAGLLVWVAWHENRSQLNAPPETKTARLEQPVAPPPPASRDDHKSISADELARVSKDQSAIGGAVPAKPVPEAKDLKQFEKRASRGRAAHPEPQADKEAGARSDTARDSLAAANRASQAVEVQAPTADAQSQNQQVQQNMQAQNQANGLNVSGPNPSRAAEAAKKRKSESPTEYRAATAAPQPAPPPVMAYNDSAALRMAAAIGPSVIAAPDGKSSWRAGHAGVIEFSNNGGASWSRQTSNVFADLTAGSAPSDKVCWIVGRAGTILLTTDAGAHWVTIHSPLAEDLGGVRATDALHATIWNLANTKTLETSDGGITWKPAASQ